MKSLDIRYTDEKQVAHTIHARVPDAVKDGKVGAVVIHFADDGAKKLFDCSAINMSTSNYLVLPFVNNSLEFTDKAMRVFGVNSTHPLVVEYCAKQKSVKNAVPFSEMLRILNARKASSLAKKKTHNQRRHSVSLRVLNFLTAQRGQWGYVTEDEGRIVVLRVAYDANTAKNLGMYQAWTEKHQAPKATRQLDLPISGAVAQGGKSTQNASLRSAIETDVASADYIDEGAQALTEILRDLQCLENIFDRLGQDTLTIKHQTPPAHYAVRDLICDGGIVGPYLRSIWTRTGGGEVARYEVEVLRKYIEYRIAVYDAMKHLLSRG
jgi:hypothetical protein